MISGEFASLILIATLLIQTMIMFKIEQELLSTKQENKMLLTALGISYQANAKQITLEFKDNSKIINPNNLNNRNKQ